MKIISPFLYFVLTCFAISSCNKDKTSNASGSSLLKLTELPSGSKNVGATRALNVIVIGAQTNEGAQIILRVQIRECINIPLTSTVLPMQELTRLAPITPLPPTREITLPNQEGPYPLLQLIPLIKK